MLAGASFVAPPACKKVSFQRAGLFAAIRGKVNKNIIIKLEHNLKKFGTSIR
jgi:hypothetical protein